MNVTLGEGSMKILDEIGIYNIGTTVQIVGLILSGPNSNMAVPFPDEDCPAVMAMETLAMDTEDWARFMNQSDILEVEAWPMKAILRKSQRQIDASVSWAVFKRDGYRCRYCAKEGPLTVDHIILWEAGGPSTEENLISSCKKDNRTRGSMPYDDWIHSDQYKKISKDLSPDFKERNLLVLERLFDLEKLKVSHVRSR